MEMMRWQTLALGLRSNDVVQKGQRIKNRLEICLGVMFDSIDVYLIDAV